MTDDEPLDGTESAHGHMRRICFKTGPPGRVGAELEWLVAGPDPRRVVPLPRLEGLLGAAGPPPGGSRVTLEPGGQVELSSLCCDDLDRCLTVLTSDVAHLKTALATARLRLVPRATDPHRHPRRQVHAARYDAMEKYFDTLGHDLGRVMMNSTAAVQANLDIGRDEADAARRWRLLHLVGPTLVATFANSPEHRGVRTGWKSTRQAVWLHLDPARTHAPVGADPAAAWAGYALDAPVMVVRRPGAGWAAAPGFTFRQWLAGDTGFPRPTAGDLDYHLTTLFPPVRPRGWFEVRYVDAQAPCWWTVPITVLATILADPSVAATVEEACRPTAGAWIPAARHGLAHPALAAAARAVLDAVLAVRPDPVVVAFAERYTFRGRCPADDAPVADPPAAHAVLAQELA